MKKSFALILALVLVVTAVAGGTIAWLTAESGTVTNTFTVGNITIDLKEHALKDDGTLDTSKTVTENKNYKVVPGATQPKDPFVTVSAKSEKCWVYAKVTNNLLLNGESVVAINKNTNWTVVASDDNVTLYRYNVEVDALTEAKTLEPVFDSITYDGDKITAANIGDLNGKTIVIEAYAHQSANTTQTVADTAAKAWADISAT